MFTPSVIPIARYSCASGGTPRPASALEGYNGSLIAMGQSGSGKTYTMHEASRLQTPHEGIAPRMLRMLCERARSAASAGTYTYDLSMQYLHVRDESVYDLLAPDASSSLEAIPLREDRYGQCYAKGATSVTLHKPSDALDALALGGWRCQGGGGGKAAPRGHAIIIVHVVRRLPGGQTQPPSPPPPAQQRRRRLGV